MRQAQIHSAEGILYTDQYQLTMAQLYFRMGMHEKTAQFDHFFRRYPDYGQHKAGFAINAGLQWFINWMQDAHFHDEEIDYLRHQQTSDGKQLFEEDFLSWLRHQETFASLAVQAIPEGRVVHPNVPLTVVTGELASAQLLETALLNHLNFQTLIATKAARIREIAEGQPVLEFGLRRAHERGASAGGRAALIGGADFTSNVGLSKIMGLSAKGTHAHSMVQAFMALGATELDAFQAYADSYPDDCLLLVDTVDTLHSGIPNAIKVFDQLKAKGHRPIGIRLDSGDLAYLSVQAAKMLNQAGYTEQSIVLSNQLDELNIWQIKSQILSEARQTGIDAENVLQRLVYGVGTRLITSRGSSALDGVYKLVAVKENGGWKPAIKLSETPEKIPNPGHKNAWRIYDKRGQATADLLSLAQERPSDVEQIVLRHPSEPTLRRTLLQTDVTSIEPLLVDIWRHGEVVYEFPTLQEIREQRTRDVKRLDAGVRRLVSPHIYHVSLTERLWNFKQDLIHAVEESG